ncbi:MAG: DUF933 domain-containing protein [Candidatus Omnitrophota bacterium]|nr:DUF933 domain-containing protein [Candidatus Omnitrophota bacterium]
MKISLFAIPEISPGKCGVRDPRLDELHKLVKSKKETYCSVELVGEDAVAEADALLLPQDCRQDLILRDLEFVEARISRAEEDNEKALLGKLKAVLEKEEFILNAGLSEEEKKAISSYGLLTAKPVVSAQKEELTDKDLLLAKALRESGFISFFTAGEKETRAWLIRKGTAAWEAAGEIHSDIQQGFIRAEIISYDDFIRAGGENQAKQAGKMRLEPKEYVMQDGDVTNFRFNK